MIHDDEAVEPPENITIDLTATGPQEFIDLFDIVRPVTVVQIVDDDGEHLSISICLLCISNT